MKQQGPCAWRRLAVCTVGLVIGLSNPPTAWAADPTIEGHYLDGETPIGRCLYWAEDGTTMSQGSTYTDDTGHFSLPNTFRYTVRLYFLGPHCNPDQFEGLSAGRPASLDLQAHPSDKCSPLYMKFGMILRAAKKSKEIPSAVRDYLLEEKTIERVKASIREDNDMKEEAKVKRLDELKEQVSWLKDKAASSEPK